MDFVMTDLDRRIWEEELAEFVPDEIFDTHTHIIADCRDATNSGPTLEGLWESWPSVTWEVLQSADAVLLPGRKVHRFCFGNPHQSGPLEKANAFVAREVKADPQSVAFMLVRPEMTAEHLDQNIQKHRFRGLKPYRLWSATADTVECRIRDFLPEHQIEVADKYGLIVMLHLNRSDAIGDPQNVDDLEYLTNKYPRVKWILAHCGRSYFDRPLLASADRLKNIPNLWYEISSVCDTSAMSILLEIAGPDRVMDGSDLLLAGMERGKYITFGFSWALISEHNHSLDLSHCNGQMTRVRYESLRAFRQAFQRHGYGREERNKFFYTNAKQLLASTGPPVDG